jgi:hypothetical protein
MWRSHSFCDRLRPTISHVWLYPRSWCSPLPDGLVAAGGGEQLAVRAKRHVIDRVGVADEGFAAGLAAVHIPQPDSAITAGGGQQLAVGTKRHTPNRVYVAGKGFAAGLVGGHVPQPGRSGRRWR